MDPKAYHSQEAGRVVLTSKGYWAFVPNPLPPDITWSSELISILAEAERDLSKLTTLSGSFPFPRLLVQPFVRNEAVISSRIEGTQANLVEVLTFEAVQLPLFEGNEDVREVYNYVRAMDYGLERLNTLPISLRLIREVHEKLMENVRGSNMTPGEFRRSQNWIGPVGSTPATAPFVPPPVEDMHQCLAALEEFIHSDSSIPALIRIAMIHYQLEAIHPFLDGNGRVGRLLITLLLHDWGLLTQPLLNLSVYIERYRQQYYDRLLDVSRKGDWEAWLRFFLRGIGEQARESAFRMQRLQEIRASYMPLVGQSRNPGRMAAVVDFLFSRPVFTIRQAAGELGMPFQIMQSYLQKLAASGVIRETTGHARNRIFQADEILRAIQEQQD